MRCRRAAQLLESGNRACRHPIVCQPVDLIAGKATGRATDRSRQAAIRADTPHPPAQARNLFSLSVCLWDAWAAYDTNGAVGYVYHGKHTAVDVFAARNQAISYAAYRMLKERHFYSKTVSTTLAADDAQMAALGYDTNNISRETSTPAGVGNSVYEGGEFTAQEWQRQSLVLVVPPGHKLADEGREHGSVTVQAIEGEDFVGFTEELTIRRQIDRSLRAEKVSVNVVHSFDNIENIKRAVEIGSGVSILPEPTVLREVEAGALVSLHLKDVAWYRPLRLPVFLVFALFVLGLRTFGFVLPDYFATTTFTVVALAKGRGTKQQCNPAQRCILR